MKVQLKQAFHVGGQIYALGMNDIPEEKLKHAHFLRYIQLGLVLDAENMLGSDTERALRLYEKVHAAPKVAEVIEEAPLVGVTLDDNAPEMRGTEEVVDDTAPKKKSRTKK